METITTKKTLREILKREKAKGRTIGFVPTMGYLHDGHLSLMRKAREQNDIVVISIFVNPTQFGEGEDFNTYPRDVKRDTDLARTVGVDYIFAPDVQEMYAEDSITYVDMNGLTDTLCGASRPGHFRGVMTVVSKLFNIVIPDRAYFGQKDAQQAVVVKKMVKDLDFDVEIVECATMREKDGLAMSSRNVYLNSEERKAALKISGALSDVKAQIEAGERSVQYVKGILKKRLLSDRLIHRDYIKVVDAETLQDIDEIKGKVLIAIAVKIGKTRLIDNIKIKI